MKKGRSEQEKANGHSQSILASHAMDVSDSLANAKLLTHWAVAFISLTIMILWGQCDLWVISYSTNEVISVPITWVGIVYVV